MALDRRGFLRSVGFGAAGAAAAAALPTSLDAATAQPERAERPTAATSFHGVHQAGILDPPPSAAAFVAFDVVAGSKSELMDLFKAITAQARFAATGGTPPDLGPVAPPSDSGILGPEVPPDGLTVTLGVGASLFDGRFGLGSRKPKHLVPMRTFPNDLLNVAECHGDLLLQICADHADTSSTPCA
jgi:deferrochelatase/peroxidase EfeB